MKPLPLLAVLAAFASTAATAQPEPPKTAPSAFVFEEVVTLEPTQIIGDTPLGRRQRVPITGGVFSGPGLSGKVLPGGADWQLVRADGSLTIEADYMIETDDHVQIHVRNVGVVVPPKDGRPAYHWTSPVFEAPMGRYGWLNDAVFVSTLGPAGDKDHPAVRVTIYRID
jgi:hypothetical protein